MSSEKPNTDDEAFARIVVDRLARRHALWWPSVMDERGNLKAGRHNSCDRNPTHEQ